jgi:ABC-2 type transport system permease protein
MKAEFLKVRSLPTPRWCFIVIAVFFLAGLIADVIWGLGPDRDLTDVTIGTPMTIASIVFGVWIIGVEYGQKTMRQALTADPRRGRLVLSKLAVGAITITVTMLFFYLVSVAVFGLVAAIFHDQSFSVEFLFRSAADNLMNCLVYAALGAAFALVSASMAGGMTVALVFIFVLDTIIAIIPKAENFSFGVALSDVSDSIRGSSGAVFSGDGGTHTLVVAVLIVAAWLLVLLGAGFARFWNSDVK